MQKNYEFRQELLQIHKPGLRCTDYVPAAEEICLSDGISIVTTPGCSEVITTAARDLQDYLQTSMGISACLKQRAADPAIVVGTAAELGRVWAYEPVPASYEISVAAEGITVCGYDDRGCAQGLYQLEDRMNRIRAPYLTPGVTHFAPAFSPRMVHSGYGQEQYPEQHMAAIAHAGMDAILYFVKGVDRTDIGYEDFNNTIRTAAKYGLDVYAYSRIESNLHPDEPGAEAYYHQIYGRIFEACPGFKGLVLVGESVEFPSKDPRVSPLKYYNNTIDGLPTGKPTAGWFPCEDYPKWLRMLQKVIYPHNPNADIVLWTYNWGLCAEEDRLALIDSLPEGISLMATFEMFHKKQMDGFRSYAADYTLAFPEAGPYFLSEAKRAKERGIRLYTQANSGGLTWDYGVIPYDPMPQMWVRRYQSMLEAREQYGLCGIMESHHYGYWPSFISRIEKLMFTLPGKTGEEAIRTAAEEFFGQTEAEAGIRAWKLLSEAHTYYPITNVDQYGPFRTGPSYPFVLETEVEIPTVPHAIHGGNRIVYVDYANSKATHCTHPSMAVIGFRHVRVDGEIRSLQTMAALQKQALAELQAIADRLTGLRQQDCLRLCNLVDYMIHSAVTTIHAKRWAKLRWQFPTLTEQTELRNWVQAMRQLAEAEIRNAEEAIPLAEADSRLGWEPSMEYIGDAAHIRWKIRQTRQVIDRELAAYDRIIDGMPEENGRF